MKTKLDVTQDQAINFAHIVKDACLSAARYAYQSAAMSGLCCEGAWEAACGAIDMLDLELVLQDQLKLNG